MKKGAISTLLYFLVIVTSIVLASHGRIITGLIWMIFAALGFIAAVIFTNAMLKDRSELHVLEDPGGTEHIVMSIYLLLSLFFSRIIWFASPEIGTFMISMDYIYASIALAFSSIALGSIFASSRLRPPSDTTSLGLQSSV